MMEWIKIDDQILKLELIDKFFWGKKLDGLFAVYASVKDEGCNRNMEISDFFTEAEAKECFNNIWKDLVAKEAK